MAKSKCSDAVFAFLRAAGVSKVFGVPGGGCMHLYNSAFITPGITLVPGFHEQAAGLAAQSYSELTGSLGVCLVTAGPGFTNVVTALAACWIESTPVLFIGGQAKTEDLANQFGVRSLGQQEVDGEGIARPLTKLSFRAATADDLLKVLPRAVTAALSGRRGPVFLEIPLDVQAELIDSDIKYAGLQVNTPPPASDRDIEVLLSALQRSKKPAMLIGAGVRASRCGAAAIDFCEKYGIAMLVTWKALQLIPESHPQNFGRPGGICQPYANDILQECDLFISVGARNDLVSVAFDYSQYAMMAERRYFVDIDPNELKKYRLPKDYRVQVDAGVFFSQLSALLREDSFVSEERSDWLNWCRQVKQQKNILRFHSEADGYVSTYQLIDSLSNVVSSRHVVVPGSSGSCSDIFMQTFRVNGDVEIQNAPGLGSMGTCLPAITGAYLAFEGSRQVVGIVGDGGFQFNLQELQTIKNLDVQTVIFVLNNAGYASIRRSQKNHFGVTIHTDADSGVTLTPVSQVAAAFGFDFYRLSANSDISLMLTKLLSSKGQILVEVMVHPDEDVRPRVGAKMVGSKIVSGNLRDYR